MRHLAAAVAAAAGLVVAGVAPAAAQPAGRRPPPPARVDPDAGAIRQAALDYIEGWWEGDPERMARAVHPELVKRIVVTRDGNTFLDQMGASRLVAGTRAAYGKQTPADRQRRDVTILDHVGNAASVKIVAGEWVDYLHVARIDGRWVIVNVLWELTPAPAAASSPAQPPARRP
jgi:hypothetical protein